MKYWLLNIAYDDSFFGFQIQPDVRTVQGEILRALSPIGIKKVYGSSRTDTHVRSASSIIEVQHDDGHKVCKIVDSIKGIAVRGYFESDEFINLRKTLTKEYLYFCDRRLNERNLKKAVKEFLKGHIESFSKDPSRKVILSGISFSVRNSYTIFLFQGKSFSWSFVRIAAETISRRAEGVISDDEWNDMLSGKKRSRYRGDPRNLILYRTRAPFSFVNYESRNITKLKSRIFQDFFWLLGVHENARDFTKMPDFLE
ncbi:MAG: hypothetical protein QXU18_05925 [Thermoplasmatales archaeon]